MSIPENHLDAVVSTSSIDVRRRVPMRTVIIAVVSLPVFFMLCFTLAYTSALHAPKPHDLSLTIAGPAQTTQELSTAVTNKAAGAFDVTRTTSLSDARKRVEEREAVGAILIDGKTVTTVIGSGGGLTAAQVVEQVGQQVATNLGTTPKVVDVAPVTSKDATGSTLFFFIVICTIGGYLSITVLSQVLPKARARTQLATSAGAAILTPVIGFGAMSLFVGDYGATFGEIAAVLGIGMVYTFTIAVFATLLTRVLKQAAIFGVVLLIMSLNFPSAGGGSPEAMLPGFWQVVHNSWFGAGAMEAIRSIVYFNGHQVGRWLVQLLIWTFAILVVTLLQIAASRRGRSAPTPEPSSTGGAHAAGTELVVST